jgi:integrase
VSAKKSCPMPSCFRTRTADSWTRPTIAPGSQTACGSLGIPKLNFQVIRRTIATRAQSLGSVKDIQSHLRHSRADTTANEYMQELPESVQQMVGTVFALLTSGERSQMVN